MAKDAADVWRDYFRAWPEQVERRGIIVVGFGEQIPFDSFALGEDLLLVERRAPDSLGGRTILLAYGEIVAVKFVDVVKLRSFQSAGFEVPSSGKK